MRIYHNRDFLGGLALAGVGLVFLVASLGLTMGTPQRMGPGFLPAAVAAITIALGAVIALVGLRDTAAPEAAAWRETLFILGGVAAFALIVPRLGMVPGVFAAIVIAGLADRQQQVWQLLALGAGAALAGWVIFIVALRLPVPALTLAL